MTSITSPLPRPPLPPRQQTSKSSAVVLATKKPVTHFSAYSEYGTEDIYLRKPDASLHAPSPAYLHGLLEAAGITQEAAVNALGITERVLRYHLNSKTRPAAHQSPMQSRTHVSNRRHTPRRKNSLTAPESFLGAINQCISGNIYSGSASGALFCSLGKNQIM